MNTLTVSPTEIHWNSALPIFAASAFLKTVGDEYGWIGGIDSDQRIRCVLPFTIIRKPGMRITRFRMETLSFGEALSETEERNFLNSVVEYFRSSGADMIIPSGNTAIFRTYPDHALAAPYGTYINDLTQSEQTLMSSVRKTYRNNIRRAAKAGVRIKRGKDFAEVAHSVIAATLRKAKLDFKSAEQFAHTIESLAPNVEIFVAEQAGRVQGCLVSPYSQYAAYNWYCGSIPDAALGSMHLLHWEAMCHFRALGVKRFDFQGVRIQPEPGSKQEGIMNYKKGFGGAFIQGFMWKYRFHPIKWAAYSLAMRLRGGDVVDQERHKLPALAAEEMQFQ